LKPHLVALVAVAEPRFRVIASSIIAERVRDALEGRL
jgi:hypothetical protein